MTIVARSLEASAFAWALVKDISWWGVIGIVLAATVVLSSITAERSARSRRGARAVPFPASPSSTTEGAGRT